MQQFCPPRRYSRGRLPRWQDGIGHGDGEQAARAPRHLIVDETRVPQLRHRYPVRRVLEARDVEHEDRVARPVGPANRREMPSACRGSGGGGVGGGGRCRCGESCEEMRASRGAFSLAGGGRHAGRAQCVASSPRARRCGRGSAWIRLAPVCPSVARSKLDTVKEEAGLAPASRRTSRKVSRVSPMSSGRRIRTSAPFAAASRPNSSMVDPFTRKCSSVPVQEVGNISSDHQRQPGPASSRQRRRGSMWSAFITIVSVPRPQNVGSSCVTNCSISGK